MDGISRKFTFPLDTRQIENEGDTHVPRPPFDKIKLQSGIRTTHGHPVIDPAPFGVFGPVFDVFALFQNAVKKQILQAYNMIEVLLRHKYEVTHTHTDLFFEWFATFEDVVMVLFDVEDDHVFPLLEEYGVRLPPSFSVEARREIYDEIEVSLAMVAEKKGTVRLSPPGETIPHISALLNDFLHIVIRYFDTQTRLLPRLIFDADIDAEAEVTIRFTFINALRAKNNYSISIPFIAHWMSEAQLRLWKSEYLGPLISVRFEQWCRKFDSTHGAIPSRIARKLISGIEHDESDFPPPYLFCIMRFSGRRRYRNYDA